LLTPGIEPVLHAISLLSHFDWILLLQPTSPLRTAQDIDAIAELAESRNAPAAVSVCEASSNPYWTYLVDTTDHLTPLVSAPLPARRQELPAAYALNGALYLAKRDWLLENRTFVTAETLGYVMPLERSVDIDTPLDWKWAEFLMEASDHG
jgi:N-acylneuraminate cytidylyltransferase